MRIRFSGLCLVALLGLIFTLQLGAQKKTKAPKMMNVQGSVQSMDKSKMTISVNTGGNTRKDVIYTADTKFLMGHSNDNKPGSADDVKDNFYVSCSGTYEAGKPQLMAKTCVYRATK